VKLLGDYDAAVSLAAANLDPSVIAGYLYNLSKTFSRFYHDCPVLQAASLLAAARLGLCRAALRTLRRAFRLICVPFLEAM